MTGVASRWMPYNGAHGEEQLAWLEAELGAAKAAGERVVVLTHVGVSRRDIAAIWVAFFSRCQR